MTSVNIVSAFLGALLSVSIVFLTRRDHLSPFVAARWFLIAVLVLCVSFFPGIVDAIGERLGIGYPPIIAVITALGAALVKILLMDIERQKLAVKLDKTVQRLALLEQMVESEKVVNHSFSNNAKRPKENSN